uniref:PCNA-interacting partner n=1 Tax=Salmo trutta TaxID=8032 RepID=A0A673ZQ22_SALTR
VVRTFRRECLRVLESERTNIHGADGMLMVLQLAIAEVNKQESGEFSVALSDVQMAWKHLLLDKLHLPLYNDSSRPENYDIIRKEYDSFLKRTNTMDLIDIHSMYKQLRVDLDPEEPLSSVQLFQFLSSNMETYEVRDSLSQVPSTPSSKSKPCSTQVNRYVVRRVFCAYLDQLVNSKNDMALAHTLDTPSRSLGRIAFTDLKHGAVTSFVRVIQLGGKGYAPTESDPLRKHVKGLSDFLHFTDNLEEILGDNPNPSIAGVRLVTSIRAALLKGQASGDIVYAAADETAKDLKERIAQIHLSHRLQSARGTGISPARPRYHTVKVFPVAQLVEHDALALPCRNKAVLRAADQAVLSGEEGTCMLTLFRSPEVPTGSSPKPLQHRFQERQDQLKPKVHTQPQTIRSQFACTYQDDSELPLNRVLDFPSTIQGPICVHQAPKKKAQRGGATRGVATALGPRSGNDAPSSRAGRGGLKTNIQTEGSSKACKRKLVDCSEHCGSEYQPPLKKPPTSVTSTKLSGKNGGAKAPSKKKLIAGQGELTSFFRLLTSHCRVEVECSTSNVALFNQWSVFFQVECSCNQLHLFFPQWSLA